MSTLFDKIMIGEFYYVFTHNNLHWFSIYITARYGRLGVGRLTWSERERNSGTPRY